MSAVSQVDSSAEPRMSRRTDVGLRLDGSRSEQDVCM
mgnify:CR=1 FL=1